MLPSLPILSLLNNSLTSRCEIDHIRAELLNIIQRLPDLLVGDGGYLVEPLAHHREDALLRPIRLLQLYYIPHYVLCILHVHLQQLDCLALSLDLLKHLSVHNGLESCGPVVVRLLFVIIGGRCVLNNHTVQEYLDDDEEILVGEKHKVLQRGIDAGFGWRIDVWASMGKEMEKLNETSNRQGFKLLRSQQSLSQVNVLDDLQSNELCHMHGIGSG